MVLSGNCNSCLGTIAGINSAQLGVVWFDAHGEFNTPETTQSGFSFSSFANCIIVSIIYNLFNSNSIVY